MQVRDTIAMHHRDRAGILSALDRPFDGPRVVMTHHVPIPEMIQPRFVGDVLTPAFVSDLRPEITTRRIDAWICGHTHPPIETALDGAHGPIPFLANCRGYPGETTNFVFPRLLSL